jgi:sugar-specific transcriptional regulator TrmB
MSNFLPLVVRHILELMAWSSHEINVYSVLLEKGSMTLSRVAFETNLGTSSVQYALKKLHGRKMVTKFLLNSQPRWKAKELDALRKWFKGQSHQFHMNEVAIQQFIDQYDFHPDGSTPSVEFHEGMKAVKKSLEEIGNRCTSNKILAISLLHKGMNAELLEFIQNGYATGLAKGMDIRILAAGDAMTGRSIRRFDEVRLREAMQLSDNTNALLVVADDTVYAMHCDKKGMSSTMMEYPQMAGILRGMFECLWDANNC